jgi:hypothetical protein
MNKGQKTPKLGKAKLRLFCTELLPNDTYLLKNVSCRYLLLSQSYVLDKKSGRIDGQSGDCVLMLREA